MEIYSYLLAFIIFHGMILSQTSCMVNASLGRLSPPPPPPKSSPPVIQPSPNHKPPKSHPPSRPLPPSKVNDGHHPSLPPSAKILPPPPHTYGSPRYHPTTTT